MRASGPNWLEEVAKDGFCNHAESFNNWYQRTLPHFGRAASYTVAGQQLDLLAAACLRNAITFAAWMDDDED